MRLLPQSISSFSLCRASVLAVSLLALFVEMAQAASPQITASPASLVFGTVAVGQSQQEEVVLVNNGETTVTISAFSVNDSAFSISGLSLPATIAPGGRAMLTLAFAPSSTSWTYGDVVFTSDASNPQLRLPLAGAGGKIARLKAQPSSVTFGGVSLGQTATVPVVVTNTSFLTVTLTALRGFGTGFSASGLTLPASLAPGESATLKVSFAPTAGGAAGGSILIEGGSLNIPVTGTGQSIGQLTLSPTALNFGNVDIGSTAAQSVSLTATGGAVTVSSATSSNAQFAISGISFPLTLSSGQSTEFKLTFSPTTAASSSATVTVSSNASDSSDSETASGTGVAAQYSVSLSWTASSSPVSGYNVYRGAQPGAYSRINPSLDTTTTYVDNTVASGSIYYYAATAVNASGQESGYSAPIKVSIP